MDSLNTMHLFVLTVPVKLLVKLPTSFEYFLTCKHLILVTSIIFIIDLFLVSNGRRSASLHLLS